MTRDAEDGMTVACRLAKDCPEASRERFLKELLAGVAAGLVVQCGKEAAAEACYRMSDAVVARA